MSPDTDSSKGRSGDLVRRDVRSEAGLDCCVQEGTSATGSAGVLFQH
jgi:hypothetical protein